MAILTREEIEQIGFASVGNNVLSQRKRLSMAHQKSISGTMFG